MCQRSAASATANAPLINWPGWRGAARGPIPYRVDGEAEPRVLDETALAGIAYGAGMNLGRLPAVVRAALAGDTAPLIAPLRRSCRSAARARATASRSGRRGVGDVQRLPDPVEPPRDGSRPAASFRRSTSRTCRGPFFPFSKQAWTSAIIDRGNLCVRWPDRHPPVQRTTGPFADVPVLVLSGDLDANTPTEEGRQAARQFRDARVIEVPNVGHVPERASGCPAVILTNFIRRLQVGDISCLADIPPIPAAP